MNLEPGELLGVSLCGYLVGAASGLLFMGRDRIASALSFGAAALSAFCGFLAGLLFLSGGADTPASQFDLSPWLTPYVQLTVRLDALGAFFLVIVGLLGFSLSTYSMGYARSFFGRKNVGVLGAFFNALLLATTLIFAASNIWLFLIA